MMYYSFIIPVYNRPEEIRELLNSMCDLNFDSTFGIVIVEDGSTLAAADVVKEFSQLHISYYKKPNSGPGDSRNFGMRRAKGNYFIILDSDCLLPPHYLSVVDRMLKASPIDFFGGPDAAHESFTPLQKAINYVMTSFLTTGGLSGGSKAIQPFEPRSFNMGISKNAFEKSGGFGKIHPGEDPDLTQRLWKMGFKSAMIKDAFVYHKRRISWGKFYHQVKKFGLVRPILNLWHPESAKLTFWFPSLFMLGTLFSVILSFLNPLFILPLVCYLIAVLVDSSIKNQNLYIGFLSLIALFVQFFGYGAAYIKSFVAIHLFGKDPKERFPFLFFE